MEKVDCTHTFMLTEAFRRGALRVNPVDAAIDAFGLARGEVVPTKPVEFVRAEGRTVYDVIGTGEPAIKLLSSRMIDVLRRKQFGGWLAFPVNVYLADGSRLSDYHGIATTGRCGPIDDRLSERITIPPRGPGGEPGPGLRGICFDPASWDGSDIFTPDEYTSIFIVDRVRRALEEVKMTNASIKRLSEIERMWRADGNLVE